MNWKNIIPLSLGLLAGVLSAISILQYQGLSMPTIAPDPEYALGGTSFYFVSLLNKRAWDRTKKRDGDGGNMDEIEEWLGSPLGHEGDENMGEIEEWLGPLGYKGDKNMGRTKHEKHEQEEEEEEEDYREEAMGLDADLMEIASSPDFDTFQDAQRLKDKMKVLCMVALVEQDVAKYSTVLENTWTKHCTRVMFVSNTAISVKTNVLRTDLKPGKSHSWQRTKILLMEAHDRFVEEFDWFVKVPRDGFVVLDNLRYLLLLHQASIPGYIGHVFKGPSRDGSALVLSRYALEVIVPTLVTCSPSYFQGFDDGEVLETCFRNLNVISMMDGRDQSGILQFQMKVPRLDIPDGATSRKQWNWRYTKHPERQDDRCCQEYPILFQNVDIAEMYTLEYAVYHLRPFGIGNYTCTSSILGLR
ncbi:glycoprotein-N-acetylgalactosamine 3-beta-galactosyltransferase 1 [Strongylocentrotus purpuratus]|uniref:N-acetylgalactosaminide beta-1,3-galactosyltransferase n=1 Tax=Strongylocentrotus purpuratus TaxID=7668 RepID=A0A7M7GND5_STRPU|nr:glycoprotein-N-acetylgalactosamine 3-beta-galactosyltransferase 1 [Strongylocentrotus purpuratus]XP_030845939.1 glycoprotein-N-acetylgalactosamine 3-beta-galactosyltransferase 1 [Strongylocentrotus purpuratus]